MTRPTPPLSRRALLRSGGLLAGAAVAAPALHAMTQVTGSASGTTSPTRASDAAPDPAAAPLAPPADPTRVQGLPSEPYGTRSPFETAAQLTPTGVVSGSSWTPHQELLGTITPADLHFQRHHNGIPFIDPARFTLTLHGLVDKPLTFTMDELRRFPSVTRTYFIECSGNGGRGYNNPKPELSPQIIDGLTSNTEWTGVSVATLLRAVGVKPTARWVLAEGSDAAVMTRSIPLAKMLDDALVVYAQNGEALRPANGYPIRLLLPGWEGNMCVKWLRRLEVTDMPGMTREETSKYTDPLPDGTSRQFSFVMDVKSMITSPTWPYTVPEKGWWTIRGLAWTGRGAVRRVDVSTDGGRSWQVAQMPGGAPPLAHTRFELPWYWDGRPARLMSRAIDETGAVQPTLEQYRKVRGENPGYHLNAIRSWDVAADGTVTFGG